MWRLYYETYALYCQEAKGAGPWPDARSAPSCSELWALPGTLRRLARPRLIEIDYNWEVRPILSDNCYRCHGPDAKARQAGLRLDQKESAYAQAIDPGNPNQSELMKRITSKDPAYRMPPPAASAKSLTEAEVATLREWIREGAEFKPHWAFVAPVKVEPPQVPAGSHAVNVIDNFILARLAKEGLKPSREADKETLINRVTLTLTGLPPSLDDVDAFLADKSPNAYEKLVDRLVGLAGLWRAYDRLLDEHRKVFGKRRIPG